MRDLVENFWKGKCTLEEQRALLKKLEDSSELEDTLLGEYNNDISDRKDNDREYYNELFVSIKEQVDVLRKRKKIRLLYRFISLAAAAIIIIAGTLFLFNDYTETSALKADQSAAIVEKAIIRSNTTSKDISIVLKDGSVVKLKPRSSITYSSFYNTRERNITLIKGEACFKVMKQKNKPFTVNSSDILTTALGTKFTVGKTSLNEIKIKLLEGKVVVRSIRKKKQYYVDTYLTPGETVIAHLDYGKFNIQNGLKKAVAVPKVSAKTKKEYPDLIFNKELLSNVFNSLEQRYNVDIQYDIDKDSNLSFTGSVKSGESLENIISTICALNDLNHSKENNHIIISKK
jgi:transmembrane sensor